MKRHARKPGYLGPAFHEWLEWLEYIECLLIKGKQPPQKRYLAMNDEAFGVYSDTDRESIMNEMIQVDATLAQVVRSSIKYRVTYQTLTTMFDRYEQELRVIRNTMPLHLPHPWCTVVLEDENPDGGLDSYVVCLHQETPNKGDNPELGITGDEQFICANMIGYRPGGLDMLSDGPPQRLSHMPVEIHMNDGLLYDESKFLYALPDGVRVHEAAENTMALIRGCILLWMNSMHLSAVLRNKSVGVPPLPRGFRPKRFRKKRQHPNFEHFVIELPVDQVPSDPTGRTCIQPHKRLHHVRGFWRHYQSGKTVWVRPHWRGDESLGVVRNDYEITVQEES